MTPVTPENDTSCELMQQMQVTYPDAILKVYDPFIYFFCTSFLKSSCFKVMTVD